MPRETTARRGGRPAVLLLALLFLALAALAGCAPTPQEAASPPVRVYYAGPASSAGGVREALDLAVGAGTVMLANDPAQADVLVFNGAIPDPAAISAQVQAGAGLVLILGPDLTAEAVSDLLGVPVTLAERDEPLSLSAASGVDDPAVRQIIWNSAPQVRKRMCLEGAGLEPLVTGFEDGSLILGRGTLGRGQVFVFTPFLAGANPQIQDWGYFNYTIYHLAAAAGGREPMAFSAYAASPVPHAGERRVLLVLLAAMLLTAGLAFWAVRRYSLAHPEALDRVVQNTKQFEKRQAWTDWEEIGFHRPLGGFLFALGLGLFLFVPLIIYQAVILPVYILPSAQALGLWNRVSQLFTFLWTFFDMGTSVALIKFFSQYRVDDPKRSVKYVQVFVWWQALSGAVQVAAVTLLASTVIPDTAYALYAWAIVAHALIQIPGFYQVFRHALIAWQRFDYGQMLDMGLALVIPMIAQPVIVTVMVAWGRAHPIIGASMGGVVGLALAAYAAEALTFLLGWWLYGRLGYNARLLFLAHFDWGTIKESFRFGAFEMLGSLAWATGEALVILITQGRLINYAEVWGNWGLANSFIQGYTVLQTLFANLMPAISEAVSHARIKLGQYYAAVAYKWGGLVSSYVAAVLLAVADRFILGASGPEFVRAATYAAPAILWGFTQFASWVADTVQDGSNRPQLRLLMTGMEQVLRISLALVLLARFQIYGLIAAYFVGIVTKDVVSYFINGRVCFPQRFYVWQSLVAPILAGAAHYAVLRPLTGLIWQGDQVTSIIILFISLLPSLPVFAFFYALFGGWDDDSLTELRRAVDLSSFMRPVSWLFWAASVAGARVSPLHGRFPITVRREAVAEAEWLTGQRVRLA